MAVCGYWLRMVVLWGWGFHTQVLIVLWNITALNSCGGHTQVAQLVELEL